MPTTPVQRLSAQNSGLPGRQAAPFPAGPLARLGGLPYPFRGALSAPKSCQILVIMADGARP